MSPLLYEIVVYFIESLISGIFLINVLEEKYCKAIHAAIWCAITAVSILCTEPFTLPRLGLIAFSELIYACFMFKDRLRKRIGAFFIKELFLIAAYVISFAVCSLLIVGHGTHYVYDGCEDCICRLLYLLIFSVLTSIVFQFTKQKKGTRLHRVVIMQLLIGLGEATAILAVAVASNGTITSKNSCFIIIATACMVVGNIFMGMLVPYLLRKITLSANLDYIKNLSVMDYKYYEMSVANNNKLRSIKHDVSNHIQTAYSLFSNGETQRGIELINELRTRYATVDQMVFCNNPVVNIILANKKSEAEEKNIEMWINVKENPDCAWITDFDLSTVICNLLDNAISGCIFSEQSHPRISVEILRKNRYLVIKVLNSCKVGMNIESTDRLETTKENGVVHGLGMPIIASIAQKYRGDFAVSAQNGIFTATVAMAIKEARI